MIGFPHLHINIYIDILVYRKVSFYKFNWRHDEKLTNLKSSRMCFKVKWNNIFPSWSVARGAQYEKASCSSVGYQIHQLSSSYHLISPEKSVNCAISRIILWGYHSFKQRWPGIYGSEIQLGHKVCFSGGGRSFTWEKWWPRYRRNGKWRNLSTHGIYNL